MKNNSAIYIIGVFVVLSLEFTAKFYNNQFWTYIFRALVWSMMGMWYFQKQKENFGVLQKTFLTSIVLPVIDSITFFLLNAKDWMFVFVCTHLLVWVLWIYCFEHIKKNSKIKKSIKNEFIIMPFYYLIPSLFYFFALYQSLTLTYAILIFFYTLIISYTGYKATFLPVEEEKRFYIITAIVLLILMNIITTYSLFLQSLNWAYPVVRIFVTVSMCIMIYGMIDINIKKQINI